MRRAFALVFMTAMSITALMSSAREPAASQRPADAAAATPKDQIADSAEEQTLRAAGLRTDEASLLEFFQERTRPKVEFAELLTLARQLGDSDGPTRTTATAKLVAAGAWALPALRHVANELDNELAAQQARRCLEWIEGPRGKDVPIAAAKMLAARNPATAPSPLLAFLPVADDEAVVDAVKTVLSAIAARPGKTDPALLAALQDPLPLRRAIAAEVLAASGHSELLPHIRKLLADNMQQVRLRAALALAQSHDAQAVGVLVDLLADLPRDGRLQVEKTLQELAGEWAPTLALQGDDALSRKVRHEAWAGWWRTVDGPALLAAIRRRTVSKEDRPRVESLIDQLADNLFAKRERAETELMAMGPKVVGFLRQAAKSTDVEQARRAEILLKKIAHNEETEKLPSAAPRLLALRKPPGAAESLLAYLAFTDDRSMKEEIGKALKTLVIVDGQPDPAVLEALNDLLPVRRIAAAEALVGAGGAANPVVRKLLTDANAEVRLHVALALVNARDKEAVPALIDLLAELPRDKAWEAEELLRRLAGAAAPVVSGDDAAARKKVGEAWHAWWKANGPTVDLAELGKAAPMLGLTVVAELGPNGIAPGAKAAAKALGSMGRLVALDGHGQQQWQIENLGHPIDFQVLSAERVLIAEYTSNRVTERDLKGKILWEVTNLPGAPINVQRLANGNTFIVAYNSTVAGGCFLVEVDRAGKTVSNINASGGLQKQRTGYVRAAFKTPDGQMICLMSTGQCLRLDAAGKDMKSFPMPVLAGVNFFGNIDVTPKGHVVVCQNNNTVLEFDPDGKIVWQVNATGNRPTRLASGNTLVASQTAGVVELDSAGKTVWQYLPPQAFKRCEPGHPANHVPSRHPDGRFLASGWLDGAI